ncbi:MAG: AMP-binding protein [Pseudomonadota bacterium]
MTLKSTERATLAGLLSARASGSGDAVAIRLKRRGIWLSLKWSEMQTEAGAVAAAMTARGLQAGDHVALLSENRPRLFTAIAAAHAIGAVAVPLYSDAPAGEVGRQIKAVGATMVFAENQEQVDKVIKVLPDCPTVKTVVFDDDRGMRHYGQSGLASFETLVEQGRGAASTASAAVTPDMPAFVFFTSGTGDLSSPVVFTHAAAVAQARRGVSVLGLTDEDRTIAYLPPGWICQMMMTYGQALASGMSIWCPESSDTLLEDMREVAPTSMLVTPRVLDAIMSQVSTRMEDTGGLTLKLFNAVRAAAEKAAGAGSSAVAPPPGFFADYMLNRPLRDALGLSHLRAMLCAGDLLDPGMLMLFRNLGINLKQLYGTTETGYLLAMQGDTAVRTDSAGRAVSGVELKVDQAGEIVARGEGFASGYLGDDAATAALRTDDGWMRTGDQGTIGADGSVQIVGRGDSIGHLADGTRIEPRMIESRVRTSPYIREAVAFGDGRDSVCALIDINTLSVGRWADDNEIPYSGHADLASQSKVYELVAGRIAEVNRALAADPATAPQQISRFVLLPQELSTEDEMLSRLGKLRRSAIAKRYASVIEALFNGAPDVALERAIDESGLHTHDDEHPARLRIGDAPVVSSGQTRSAA